MGYFLRDLLDLRRDFRAMSLVATPSPESTRRRARRSSWVAARQTPFFGSRNNSHEHRLQVAKTLPSKTRFDPEAVRWPKARHHNPMMRMR